MKNLVLSGRRMWTEYLNMLTGEIKTSEYISDFNNSRKATTENEWNYYTMLYRKFR